MKVYSSPYADISVPDESIFTHLYRTRFDHFPPDHAAFIDAATGKTITRAEFRDTALSMAWGLRHEFHRLGGVQLQRGDVVMVFSPNSILWPVMLFGGIAAGLRMTLANVSYTPREVMHQWTDSRAKAVFVHPTLLPVVLETFKLLDLDFTEVRRRIIIADWPAPAQASFNEFIRVDDILDKGVLQQEEQFNGELAHETVLLCYSSGTTGQAKGVETSHRNLVAVLGMCDVAYPNLHEEDPVMLGILPFYHIYGAVKLLHFPWIRGMPVVIMSKFDPVEACKNIEKYKVTEWLVVPPVCLLLTHHPAVAQYNVSSLKLMISGAAPLGGPLVNSLRTRFKSYGADVVCTQGYGLTETSPTTHCLPPEDCIRKVGTVGPLFPSLEARLVIEDTQEAEEGEPGELWIRGPTIMKGYLGNPEATANAITPDGWFKTGDIAIRDEEGFYSIVDRRKELIKYKGFQVPPAELESILLQHPEIIDVAVVGVESVEEATELPRAYVVHAKGLTPPECELFGKSVQEWIKPLVARHKYLRGGVVVTDIIPKSAAGKILRRELRQRAKLEAAASKKTMAKL